MGYFNSWPPIKRESWEILAAAEPLQRPIPPSPEQIDRMLEAMHCIQCLEVEQRHLVWMRAEGYRWRDIASRFGCNRTTAWRRWQSALQTVLQGLHTGALHPKIVSNVG
jgi:DNA-directed RNA polymerase specialized sigma24 family protein